jgi:hypothetical protein
MTLPATFEEAIKAQAVADRRCMTTGHIRAHGSRRLKREDQNMGESKLRKRLGLGPTTTWKRAEPKTRVAADYEGTERGRRLINALEKDPEFALYQRFTAGYTGHFYAKHGTDAPLDSGSLLDTISDLAFDPTGGGALIPVSKAKAFSEYRPAAVFGGESSFEDFAADACRERTEAEAEAALAFLQAEGMVEVEGDEIRVPARFWLEPSGPA